MQRLSISEVNSSDAFRLSLIRWQFVAGLSFRSETFSEGRQVAIFKGALRTVTRALGVRFRESVWALKLEWGELGDRPHFHALLTGFPASQVTLATCRRIGNAWKQKGGGHELEVSVLEQSKPGLAYVAKQLGPRLLNRVRNTAKFGVNGKDMLFSDNFVWAAESSAFRARSLGSFLRE